MNHRAGQLAVVDTRAAPSRKADLTAEPSASVSASILTTACIPSRRQFAAYAEAVAASWDVQQPDREPLDFDMSMRLVDLGTVLFWQVRGAARQVRRSLPRTRADGQDHYIVLIPSEDAAFQTGNQVRVEVAAREVWVFDMARSITLFLPAGEVLAFYVRRDALDTLLAGSAACHGVRLDSLAGMMVRKHARALSSYRGELNRPEAAGAAQAVTHLLAAGLAVLPRRTEPVRVPLHVALMQGLRKYVNDNLCERDLSAEQLCRVLGVSRSTLYRLMEPHGGVAAYVQGRRLARVHALLSGTQDRRRIAELAYSHGFISETHFSRAFRRRYGYSPSEARGNGPLLPSVSGAAPKELCELHAGWLLGG